MNKTFLNLWRENRRFLLFIMLMVIFRSSFADWNSVPTGSMKPTIIEGDRIWVDKLAYDIRLPLTAYSIKHLADPQRGDIVIFNSKVTDKRLVKRVIGLPGETLMMRDNVLSIDGKVFSYQIETNINNLITAREQFNDLEHKIWIDRSMSGRLVNFAPIVVPDEHYLVLGDNRNNSADSRVIGFVPRTEIIGKTTTVVMSFDFENYYKLRAERFLKEL